MKLLDLSKIPDRVEALTTLARLPDNTPLTIQEAGVVLNVSAKHIWRQIAAGNDGSRVPRFYRRAGARAWQVRAGTLREWMAADIMKEAAL
jgi:hypothetical protein